MVLDFCDKTHNLDAIASLTTAIPEMAHIIEKEEEGQREDVDRTPKIQIDKECNAEFDVLGTAKFAWVDIGNGEWSLTDDNRKEIVLTPKETGYVAKLYNPDGSSSEIVQKPIPLSYCFGIAEDFARRYLTTTFADPKALWMQEDVEPTNGQREFLEINNAFDEDMNKATAAVEIRRIIALKNKQRRQMDSEPITIKQRYFLKHNGIDSTGMTKLAAMKEISKIKQMNR